jgi:hypothetical protein
VSWSTKINTGIWKCCLVKICKKNKKAMIQMKQQSPDLNDSRNTSVTQQNSLAINSQTVCFNRKNFALLGHIMSISTPHDQFDTTPIIIIWSFTKNYMAQGPSWEASGCSASQEMYCLISGKFKIASSIYGYMLRTFWKLDSTLSTALLISF